MKKRGTPLVSDVSPATRFGKLVVIAECERLGRERAYLCKCDCGNDKKVRVFNLLTGNSTSCGCTHRALASRRFRKHDSALDSAYKVWCGIKQRCLNEMNPSYPHYGGRGIRICDRWRMSFDAFAADMGPRPNGMSIDRIDVNGNYEPGNCRWATSTEQARNTRLVALEPHEPAQIRWLAECGYRQTDIARHFGVSTSVVNKVVAGKTWA
jgi:hypothetical protein